MAAVSIVTVVCASTAPLMLFPVWNMIDVWQRKLPSTWDVVPRIAWSAIYQKMFSSLALPVSTTLAPLLTVISPAICKIQTCVEVPLKVTPMLANPISVPHLYMPRSRARPSFYHHRFLFRLDWFDLQRQYKRPVY